MTRNLLALVGLVALLAGLGVWQFGFLSAKVDEVSTQIERETAVARATAMIRDAERRADDLIEKSRQLRVKARAQELAAERTAATAAKTRQAMTALATAARSAGLPKPSEAGEAELAKTINFAGRTLTGAEVYRTLERWQADFDRETRRSETTQTMIARIRTAADQLESKQSQMVASVGDVRAKLEELSMQRDLARVETELAELGASVRGEFAGDLGHAMETLQTEIDELQATTDVLGGQADATAPLTPQDALEANAAEVTIRQQLDSLWGDAKP